MVGFLGNPPGPSPHTTAAVSALSMAAARPDWLGLEDIDIPIRQCYLSHAIDESSHQFLLRSIPIIRSHALALSSGLPHGDWLNVVPLPTLGLHLQDRECRCSLSYWLGVPLTITPILALHAMLQLTSLGTTKYAVEAMVIASPGTTPSGMWFSLQPSRLPYLPQRRPLVWYLAPFPALPMFSFQAGSSVTLPL